jgi:hypothetical protein
VGRSHQGHKTRGLFHRYTITSDDGLVDTGRKICEGGSGSSRNHLRLRQCYATLPAQQILEARTLSRSASGPAPFTSYATRSPGCLLARSGHCQIQTVVYDPLLGATGRWLRLASRGRVTPTHGEKCATDPPLNPAAKSIETVELRRRARDEDQS